MMKFSEKSEQGEYLGYEAILKGFENLAFCSITEKKGYQKEAPVARISFAQTFMLWRRAFIDLALASYRMIVSNLPTVLPIGSCKHFL
jgi:hypothetical protein